MLRRRRKPQAQVARKAEARKEAHEADRYGGGASKGVLGGAEAGLVV